MNLLRVTLASTIIVMSSCSEPPGIDPGDEKPRASPPESVSADSASSKAPPSTRENAPEGMVLIPGGPFLRGGDAAEKGGDSASHQSAYPIHKVHVDAFWIDESEVTNRQFMEFVEASGYLTFAERPVPEEELRELREDARRNLARLELLASRAAGQQRDEIYASMVRIRKDSTLATTEGSMIFATPEGAHIEPDDASQWWNWVSSASWRTPGGPGTTLAGLEDHPVVNVTYEDAVAYAKWAGKRLPTEAEWEKAARGALEGQRYAWGSEMFPEGEGVWMANIWQGEWPGENLEADGFFATAPVKSFRPNAYGLCDMSGNVWEIVSDLYDPRAYQLPSATVPNSTGPLPQVDDDPETKVISRVTKGGSFLCSDVWCKGYQPGSRDQMDNVSPSNHTGFRCAMNLRNSVK